MSAGRSAELDGQHAEPILQPELGAGESECGDRLVDRAVGLGPESSFGMRAPP